MSEDRWMRISQMTGRSFDQVKGRADYIRDDAAWRGIPVTTEQIEGILMGEIWAAISGFPGADLWATMRGSGSPRTP